MASLNKFIFAVFFLIFSEINGQYVNGGGGTFAYRGDDVIESDLNFHHVFYIGISSSFVKIDSDLSLPILFTAYLEYKYLFLEKNDVINFSFSGQAHGAVSALFLFRTPLSLSVDFFNMATSQHKYSGIGLSTGIGYEPLFSTFGLNENSLFIHFSFQFENFRLQYQYKFADNLFINHGITFGMMLDL